MYSWTLIFLSFFLQTTQIHDFVSKYMPAYKEYLPGLYEAASGAGVCDRPTLMVKVDKDRTVVGGGGSGGAAGGTDEK
jgi:hypothetical protein